MKEAALRRAGVAGRRPGRPASWVRRRLDAPLYRNGYALVASSGLTSALGLVYWLVAARTYDAAAVGVSAALISAMTLVTNISQLNLKGALNRFLPRAGTRSGTFVARCYLLAVAVTVISSLVFLAGLGLWAPQLAFLTERPELGLWFVAATAAWTIFVLQDSVLAGIRQAGWVPVENFVFAVAKIALLIALVATAPDIGVFVAWSAPVLLLIVPVNLLLFRRLIPAHVRATRDREQAFSRRDVSGYVAADYSAYVIWSATIGALPLVVLAVAGAEASAHFFVSWAIAYALYLVSSGLGMSLLAEASLEPERLAEYARRTIVESARLVVPAVAIVVAGAPLLLGALGDEYAGEAVTLLRLLALSALPFVVVAAFVNVARVQRRMRRVIATYAALCGLVLAIGLPLLVSIGIEGLGVAWLTAQTIVAVALLATRLSPEGGLQWVLRSLAAARSRLVHLRTRFGAGAALRPVLEALQRGHEDHARWRVHEHLRVLNEVVVSSVGPQGAPARAVVKRARTGAADEAIARHLHALRSIDAHPELAGWRRFVPQELASGRLRGRAFVAETRLPGSPADALLRDGLPAERFLIAAERAIRPLHDATRERVTVDDALLESWVDEPLALLRPVAREHSSLSGCEAGLERVRSELVEMLGGADVSTGWIHGDLCPGNVLLGDDGGVEAIVDWEHAQTSALPQLDLIGLLVTTRMATQRKELGTVVAELLEAPVVRGARQGGVPMRALLLLVWLHHIAGNLAKSTRYGRHRLWLWRNVDPVLAAVLPAPPVAPRAVATPLAAIGVAAAGLALGVGAWLVSLGAIDPRAMSDLGLISVLPPAFVLALLALTASFAVVLHRRPAHERLLGAHLVALVAVLHATPALVYETLRYPWAWKHVGIVDYIERHDSVSTGISELGIHHNWPGFFGLDALLGRLAGAPGMLEIAAWAPFFFNALNIAALVFLFSALTRDRRVVWLAAWLFVIASWIGQDYFSPQAFAFFLYLVLMGVVVRFLARKPVDRRAVAVAVLLMTAIAVSHPLTAVMAVIALAALALFGVCVLRPLPVIAGAITIGWNVTFASDFVREQGRSTLDSVRVPWTTTESSLASIEQLSGGQALVATMARGLVAAIVLLALVGFVRGLRGGRVNRAAAVLALAPLVLFASGDYGGEILFRIYLFSLPFLAFFAGQALMTRRRDARPSWRPAAATAAVGTLLLGLYLVAYYGKDRQYYFSPDEVAAAEYVYEHARPGSLLIEGTRNYPGQFKNYEHFRYVPLALEPASSHARFVSRPEEVFSEWMSDPRHSAAFLIITRSQKAEVAELGVMPRGSLDRIERALLASPRFHPVVRNRDATVFTLARDQTAARR